MKEEIRRSRIQLNALWVLPITAPPIHYGCVVVENERILYVGSQSAAPDGSTTILNYDDAILMPGLINAHCHLNYSLLRGTIDFTDPFLTLKQISLIKHHVLLEEDIRCSVVFGALEAIRFGMTTVATLVDRHYLFAPQLCAGIGLRTIGLLSIKRNTPLVEDLDSLLAQIIGSNKQNLLSVGLMPHTVYTLSPQRLLEVSAYARRRQMHMYIHLAELREEMDFFTNSTKVDTEVSEGLRQFYCENKSVSSPVEAAYQGNILGRRTGAVHCIHLHTSDIELLKHTHTHVIVCPHTNVRMGNGLAPVYRLLQESINVCLGTDGAATSSRYDLLDEMRLLALLSRSSHPDVPVLASEDVVRMATLNGAQTLGLQQYIGSLEEAKYADIIAIRIDKIASPGIQDPYDYLVYSSRCSDVCMTMINGNILYNDGFLAIEDADLIIDRARVSSQNIRQRIYALRKAENWRAIFYGK